MVGWNYCHQWCVSVCAITPVQCIRCECTPVWGVVAMFFFFF